MKIAKDFPRPHRHPGRIDPRSLDQAPPVRSSVGGG